MTDEMWDQIRPALVDRMLATLEHDQRILLETDGGPIGLKADVYLAVLIGHDEQIDDVIRLRRAEPVWLRPIMRKLSWAAASEAEMPPTPAFDAARYVLQSSYATYRLDYMYAPKDVEPGPQFQFTVALLRYKRRL